MNFFKGSFKPVRNKNDDRNAALVLTWITVLLSGLATLGNLYLLIRGEFFPIHWLQSVVSVLILIWFVQGIKQLLASKNHK